MSSAAPSERERLLEKARLKLFDYAVGRKRATPKDVEWYADFVNECAVARAAAPQAPAGRDLDAIFSALSKLESQILPDPSLPEACTLILREAWAAIRRMQSGAAAVPAPPEPKKVEPVQRGCNRHDDCEAANAKWLAAHPGEKFVPFSFHCHDDECEDCFGC